MSLCVVRGRHISQHSLKETAVLGVAGHGRPMAQDIAAADRGAGRWAMDLDKACTVLVQVFALVLAQERQSSRLRELELENQVLS